MNILIRGAGDLATGIACRLYQSGFHQILMTETLVPTTVRRTVAFSTAVYEEKMGVEQVKAQLAHSFEEVPEIQKQGQIAVLVDEEGKAREHYHPDVLVDAIIAKKNLGTTIEDAPLVVGVGPGFTAGVDCHVVVETKRGHELGRVIREGSAIPNTGVPGNVGGYTVERIIRAAQEGRFQPVAHIGEQVKKGQTVAQVISTDGTIRETAAGLTGIVRGMLQEGVSVCQGMKCGDIDPRCEKSHCFTVSDKARAVGGGVLEAVCCYWMEQAEK